jgi:hypothetical protein
MSEWVRWLLYKEGSGEDEKKKKKWSVYNKYSRCSSLTSSHICKYNIISSHGSKTTGSICHWWAIRQACWHDVCCCKSAYICMGRCASALKHTPTYFSMHARSHFLKHICMLLCLLLLLQCWELLSWIGLIPSLIFPWPQCTLSANHECACSSISLYSICTRWHTSHMTGVS